MTDILRHLDELHDAGKFYGLSIWPTQGGYQVSLAASAPNSFRIRHGVTPSEAVAAVLATDFLDDDGNMPRMVAPPAVDEPELPTEEAGIFD